LPPFLLEGAPHAENTILPLRQLFVDPLMDFGQTQSTTTLIQGISPLVFRLARAMNPAPSRALPFQTFFFLSSSLLESPIRAVPDSPIVPGGAGVPAEFSERHPPPFLSDKNMDLLNRRPNPCFGDSFSRPTAINRSLQRFLFYPRVLLSVQGK